MRHSNQREKFWQVEIRAIGKHFRVKDLTMAMRAGFHSVEETNRVERNAEVNSDLERFI